MRTVRASVKYFSKLPESLERLLAIHTYSLSSFGYQCDRDVIVSCMDLL